MKFVFWLILLVSYSAWGGIRDGYYEDMNFENKVGYYFSNGSYEKRKTTYNDASGTHSIDVLEKNTYIQEGNQIKLGNGNIFTALDECRVVVELKTYYQQACMESYEGELIAFRTDGTLIVPKMLVVNSSEVFSQSQKYTVELKLTSNNPMTFRLFKVYDIAKTYGESGTYDLGEDDPEKKLFINSVRFVNRTDHVLIYDISFKEIGTNPLTFEVTKLSFYSAYDFWSGDDVSHLYQ